MNNTLKIDFISDIACPWCAVGLAGLNAALERLDATTQVALTFHPFELNPDMPPAGALQLDYITEKYRISADQARANREQISLRAAAVGFTMNRGDASGVYNTFDAHRLLAWARDKGVQPALKMALLSAYFSHGQDISKHTVLRDLAAQVGLDSDEAGAILAGDDTA